MVGGMQNSGMLSGVMTLGHKEIRLGLSTFSPNMMPLSLSLNSAEGMGCPEVSTDSRSFSTTHMGIRKSGQGDADGNVLCDDR